MLIADLAVAAEVTDVEVIVARVGKPHGVRGEITVEPRTDEPDRRFAVGALLRLESTGKQFTVEAMRWHQGRPLVRLSGVTDRNGAEAIRGELLLTDVPADEPAGDEADYWDRDLMGLEVRDHAGVVVGQVVAVQHPPGQDLLEIRTAHGRAFVPFVSALVPEVDVPAGYLQLADVGGLLDVADAE